MRPLGRVVGFVLVWLVVILATVGLGLLLLIPYCFLVFRGQEVRAAKANEKLRLAVMDGESFVQSALQMRAPR